MKRMCVFSVGAMTFAAAGIIFFAAQGGFAQDDFSFLGDLGTLPMDAEMDDTLDADMGAGILSPVDALPGGGAATFELPADDAAALTGEGILEDGPETAPQAYTAAKTSPILESTVTKETGAPILPPPTSPAPKSALQAPPVPVQAAAPVPAAPLQETQPVAVNYPDCPDCPPLFFGGHHQRPLFTGRVPAERAHAPVFTGGRRGASRQQPMQDPYYTLRGPRHFDDPNPRPIGR